MTFSAAGTIGATTANTNWPITPHAVGNFILLGVLAGFTVGSTASWATALSATNITWSVLVGHTAFSASAGEETLFIGKVTSTSSANTSITFNTGTPVVRTAWQEFSNTAGNSAVTTDVTGTVDGASGSNFPSVTPTRAGDLYWSFCWDTNTFAAGSTSGYTYQADANGNGMAYNLSCANANQTPNTGTADGLSGIAVMLYEAAAGVAARVPVLTPQAVKRASFY